jgi:vancomycin aglycone glucosyltransferase
MRVLLSTYGLRGDVGPMVGLAVQLRALGAEAWVCAPPDKEFAELLAVSARRWCRSASRCARW